MKQCNRCANTKCRRPSTNMFPKFKFKPGCKWDRADLVCKYHQPIVSTEKLMNHARLTIGKEAINVG